MAASCRTAIALLAGLALAAGCTPTFLPNTPDRLARGYIYYLDGAGGGAALNWAGGVSEGLLAAGFPGGGEIFTWETGLGPLADQQASTDFKRSRAALLAQRIREYRAAHPGAPVHIIALSAGTAVAVFTLEALPADCPVDSVVLLGASVSAEHDLSAALRRVSSKLYIITCGSDAVLGFLVPAAGTADRQPGAEAAGLAGFVLPPGASDATRSLYRDKLVTIPWTLQLDPTHECGTHLDNVNPEFIRRHVAPLLKPGP